MNLPNKLTISRLFLTALFVAVLTVGFPYASTLGLALFLLAAYTDLLDGKIARRRSLITNFGKLMDPLADKILMVSAFVLLSSLGYIPAWVTIIILAREFLVTGLRSLAASEGAVIAADNLGKQKTLYQFITVTYYLLHAALEDWALLAHLPGDWWPLLLLWIGRLLVALTVLFTLASGIRYFARHAELLRR